MSIFSNTSGLLGINARNLLYVSRYNSASAKKFADDKIFTKNFLSARGLGVAKLFRVLRSDSELIHLDPATLPNQFVIKPNRGYGGEGIIVITEKKKNRFVGVNHEEYSWEQILAHLSAILDGRYAISGLHDQAIFEERLIAHECFRKICPLGLPDLRIIVFNHVPVIAMLRLPTTESGGKANLHLGALGLGLDLGSGHTTYAVRHNRFVGKLPNGESVNTLQLPHWNEALLMASKIQSLTNIGYLAVDLALTENGLKVLEVNARAGLSVQLANRAFLRTRLEKVADLKITTPEQGVEIAKTLFATKRLAPKTQPEKIVLGLFEPITVLSERGSFTLTAKIDPHAQENLLDTSLQIPKGVANILLRNKRFKLPCRPAYLPASHKAVLAGKFLTDFLIDPNLKTASVPDVSASNKTADALLEKIDKEIYLIDSRIKLLSYLRPLNLAAEKSLFLANPSYAPQFTYREVSAELPRLRQRLQKIPRAFTHPLLPLYEQKILEITRKIQLIEARGTPEFSRVSARLFGSVTPSLLARAREWLAQTSFQADASESVKFKAAVKIFREALRARGLTNWRVKVSETAAVRIQVTKSNTLIIRSDAEFTRNAIMALVAHEIETHIYRLENGSRQKYHLFERGTADYLATEEGLAIWNQLRLALPLGTKTVDFTRNVLAIEWASTLGFPALFAKLKSEFQLTDDEAWQICVKVKRGLTDTSAPGAFTKNLVYFAGYERVAHFLKNPATRIERLKKLYAGKLGIRDLALVEKYAEMPKLLPQI